jgi:hypothetical protein
MNTYSGTAAKMSHATACQYTSLRLLTSGDTLKGSVAVILA